jgi:hypothetical protein
VIGERKEDVKRRKKKKKRELKERAIGKTM